MDLELIKELKHFNIYANLGLLFDRIDKFENYNIAYHKKIKDSWYNFITDIKAENKEEFDKIILEASNKMKALNRETSIAILPYMEKIYCQREIFFDDSYELVSNEVWQIFNNFKELDNIKTKCSLNVKLEKTTNMKLYSEEMVKAYQTGDKNDPYGDLDSVYKEVYKNYKKKATESRGFFVIRLSFICWRLQSPSRRIRTLSGRLHTTRRVPRRPQGTGVCPRSRRCKVRAPFAQG